MHICSDGHHRSQSLKKLRSWRILLLFDLECSNLVWICILYIYTKFWPDRISNMAMRPGGHLGKSTKSYYSWTNGWIISKFLSSTSNKDTWHNTPVFYLTYFSRSQRSKFKTNYEVEVFCYYLTCAPSTFLPNFGQSDFKYGHQVAILEKQPSAVTPELMLYHLQILIIGTSNKDTWHNTWVFDLTYFSRSQR
jgi:hypothetical protein